MEQISKVLNRSRNAPKPQSDDPQLPEVTLGQSQEAKQALATMLYQCFQTLKLYGKEPEALEATVNLFQIVLADYTMRQIEDALRFYLRHHNEMPAPADIAQIIDRGNKPPFEQAVYVNFSRKPAENRTSEEWAYMREYEKNAMTGGG